MAEPLRYRRPHSDIPDDARTRARLATPGLADELGERQFTVDSSSEALLETLRFRREFGDNPQFETALRAQVESTRHLRHASLSTVTSVERDPDAVCLISRVPSGRRLSELPPADSGWASALKTIRELMPALLVLHESGVTHGTLSTRRVIVTRDGRLVLVEHVLATAIEALNLSRPELRALGLVVGDGDGPVRFTQQTDLAQMGFLTLSLILDRQLPATDFPARVPALLDEFVQGVGSSAAASKVRTWLARAMQVEGAEPFASSHDAESAFDALSHDVAVRLAESAGALLAFGSEDGAVEETRRDPVPALVIDKRPSPAAKSSPKVADVRPAAAATPAQTPPAQPPSAVGVTRPGLMRGVLTWMIAGLAVVAIGEGAVLLSMLFSRPAAPVLSASPAVTPTPLPATVPSLPPAATSVVGSAAKPTITPAAKPTITPVAKPAVTPAARPTVTPAAKPTATPAPRRAITPAATGASAAEKFGGLTVTSPIDLQVFKDGVLLGSTAAPIAVGDGRYSLEFVNPALGFRVTLPATITGGQMTTLKVPVPNGRVSLNAVPWAEVMIDGRVVGQTPLANLSLPIGSHEVVFMHPQFGEKRQTVVVTVGGIARVTQDFR